MNQLMEERLIVAVEALAEAQERIAAASEDTARAAKMSADATRGMLNNQKAQVASAKALERHLTQKL